MTKKIVFFVFLSMVSAFASGLFSQVTVTIPDTTCMRWDTIKVPLRISSVSGLNVLSLQFQLEYDSNVLECLGFAQSGTITNSWATPVLNITTGKVITSIASTTPLSGGGVLFYASFRFVASPNSDRSQLRVTQMMLNEGTPTVSVVNGSIRYLSLNISPNEASIFEKDSVIFILQGDITPPVQWSVTDTSVASISSSGIFRTKKVGFCRVIAKDARNLADTTANIVIKPLLLSQFTMSFRDTSIMQGESILYPLYVTDLTGLGIISGQLGITFNTGILTIDSIAVMGTLLESSGAPVLNINSGNISISFARSIPLNGSGVLLYLKGRTYRTNYGSVSFHLRDALFNENISVKTLDGSIYVQSMGQLSLTISTTTAFVGDTVRCSLSANPIPPAPPIVWSVSNPTLATISSNGVLVVKKHGTLTVNVIDSLGRTAVSQTISTYDMTLTVGDTSAMTLDSVDVPVYISQYTNGILSSQMTVNFDTLYLISPRVIESGTLLAGSQISSSTLGNKITIAAAISNPIRTAGTLVKIRFYVRYTAPKLTNTSIALTKVMFNEGTPFPLIDNGQVYIRWDRDVKVIDILEPNGIIKKDTTIIPRVLIQNVRGVGQTVKLKATIGRLYTDSMDVFIGPYSTQEFVFPHGWNATIIGTFSVKCEAILLKDQDTTNNVIIKNVAVSATGGEFVIFGITPNFGGDLGLISVQVKGFRFHQGMSLKLNRAGSPDIHADSLLTNVIDSSTINTVFNLRDEERGPWNLVIKNQTGDSAIFYDGFSVEFGNRQLYLDVIGPKQIRVGRITSFIIQYRNNGNNDVVAPSLFVSLPTNLNWKLLYPKKNKYFINIPLIPHAKIETKLDYLKPGDNGTLISIITPIAAGPIQLHLNTVEYEPCSYYSTSLINKIRCRSIGSKSDTLTDNKNVLWKDLDVEIWDAPLIPRGPINPSLPSPSHGPGFLRHPHVVYPDKVFNPGTGRFMSRNEYDAKKKDFQDGKDIGFDNTWFSHDRQAVIPKKIPVSDDQYDRLLSDFNSSDANGGDTYIDCQSTLDGFFELRGIGGPEGFIPDDLEDKDQSRWREKGDAFYNNLGVMDKSVVGPLSGEEPFKENPDDYSPWDDFNPFDFDFEGIGAIDPNDKIAPLGIGSNHFISNDNASEYLINFENLSTATAAAQEIEIVDTLSPYLDINSFMFGNVMLGDTLISINTAANSYSTSYRLNPETYLDISCNYNSDTRVVRWYFRGRDYISGDLKDILPPNITSPEGQGWVSFSINPDSNLINGTKIFNRASIIFDVNPPISTNEVFNTIDADPPSSKVQSARGGDSTIVKFKWKAVDGSLGSGVRTGNIYISTNDGVYQCVSSGVKDTSFSLSAVPGNYYKCFSIAQDSVGNIEPFKTNADIFVLVGAINAGWNMVSVPIIPKESHKDSLFPGATSNAFEFVGRYEISSELEPGVGYWLKYPSPQMAAFGGNELLIDTIALRAGWNMIGSISEPIPTNSITSDPPSIVTSNFYGFENAYKIEDTICPGKAYWVKVNQSGSIILSTDTTKNLTARIKIVPTSDQPPPPPEDGLTDGLMPTIYSLDECYPNPFNPKTTIKYSLPEISKVELTIYNILGQVVTKILDCVELPGYHSIEWNAPIASGVYFYRLEASSTTNPSKSFIKVKKMILLR